MFRNIILNTLAVFATVTVMSMWTPRAHAQVEPSKHFSKEFQRTAMCSVVRIRASDGVKAWQGCGVCVAQDTKQGTAVILTAGHVVERVKKMEFEVFTTQSFPNPARVYKTAVWHAWWNKEDDIGIVVASIWVPFTMKLAADDEHLMEGTPILSIGCGVGAPPCCQVGSFAGLHSSGDYIVERGSIGGRSGGPMISSQGVVGILSRGRDDYTLFVSHDKIHKFVERVADKVRKE
jgi:hypothetical protein